MVAAPLPGSQRKDLLIAAAPIITGALIHSVQCCTQQQREGWRGAARRGGKCLDVVTVPLLLYRTPLDTL